MLKIRSNNHNYDSPILIRHLLIISLYLGSISLQKESIKLRHCQHQNSNKQCFRHLFRRDILEGTLEELTIADIETETNHTGKPNHRPRRQVKLPAVPRSGRSRSHSDVCRSTVEIATPYWASNSNGKVRAILNSDQFEQAVHQEICR